MKSCFCVHIFTLRTVFCYSIESKIIFMMKGMSTQSKRPNPPHVKMDFFRCLHEGVESDWLPTLAQADLDPPSQSILPPNIPKRISQYWHSETLPDDVARSIEKVKNNNPSFELVLTHDESARAFLRTHFGQDMVAFMLIFSCMRHLRT
ncbi:glycosyltransferase family 32 protein [Acetobacter pasteurianus]|nr:hypothetical protein [Acetobacter pasteurianus]